MVGSNSRRTVVAVRSRLAPVHDRSALSRNGDTLNRRCAPIVARRRSRARRAGATNGVPVRGKVFTVRGVRAAMVGLFLLTSACSDRRDGPSGQSSSTVAASSVTSTSAVDRRIVEWLSRIHGRAVSYIAIVSSHRCDICGM